MNKWHQIAKVGTKKVPLIPLKRERWQDSWDQQIHNKLHEIHSLVGKTPCSYSQNRKEQVVLTRCRIGHGRLTHS